ncbi:MAG: NADH-ubiquinone oxidoreductase chain C [Ktedonobacterales bacterium]|jgi:NADH-quinone oxidoreductase subunit C|nr:MAG: NADH-ubiquinone oxidoreductase chain C [Ktedonobacterales bacterium]
MAEGQTGPGTVALWPKNPHAEATVTLVRERFPDAISDVVEYRGETTIIVRAERIEEVCRALRDAPELRFNFLADITAVDWPEREPRYDVVYHLLSLETSAVIRLKLRVGDDETPNPEIATVTTVWPAANFFEREVFDLFGIRFSGHPNLTRILMPSDWVGHPLRKDYPLTGIALPEPHWGGQIPFDQPLPPGTGAQTLRTPDGVAEAPAPPNDADDTR